MKRLLAVMMASALLLAGCEQGPGAAARSQSERTEGQPTKSRSRAVGRATDIYAAVIRAMVSRNRGFEHLYVVDGPVGDADKLRIRLRGPNKPFPDELKEALSRRLNDKVPPLDFISHPDEVIQGGAPAK